MNIKLLVRTTKTSGEIPIRFRINDGRKFELSYKSQLRANIEDLKFILPDGSVKSGLKGGGIYTERNQRLAIISQQIKEEITTIEKAIEKATNIPTNSAELEELINDYKNPKKYSATLDEIQSRDLVQRFEYFIETSSFKHNRTKGYRVTLRTLKRFLVISKRESIELDSINAEFLLDFSNFITNEYKYAKSHSRQYKEFVKSGMIRERDIPLEPRDNNTLATMSKQLRAFFNDLVISEELITNPYSRIKKDKRSKILREDYSSNPKVYLTAEELVKLIKADNIPESLKQTQKAFSLQCLLGCRIGDFKRLNLDNVLVTSGGMAYISYRPEKTENKVSNNIIKTPLTVTAVRIIKESGFNFPILKNISGKVGYNKKIKELIKVVGIDREIEIEVSGKPIMIPINQLVSSKGARKTAVNLFKESQIDLYMAGLHSRNSQAVNHYIDINLENQLALLNLVLGESNYKVDKELNFINE